MKVPASRFIRDCCVLSRRGCVLSSIYSYQPSRFISYPLTKSGRCSRRNAARNAATEPNGEACSWVLSSSFTVRLTARQPVTVAPHRDAHLRRAALPPGGLRKAGLPHSLSGPWRTLNFAGSSPSKRMTRFMHTFRTPSDSSPLRTSAPLGRALYSAPPHPTPPVLSTLLLLLLRITPSLTTPSSSPPPDYPPPLQFSLSPL